jgi:hypothetical protein
MSSLRTARSFAAQAQLEIEQSLQHKSSREFDSIYLTYLTHNVESELQSESERPALDAERHKAALAAFAATDSIVRTAIAHPGEEDYFRSTSSRLNEVIRSVSHLDTTHLQ